MAFGTKKSVVVAPSFSERMASIKSIISESSHYIVNRVSGSNA